MTFKVDFLATRLCATLTRVNVTVLVRNILIDTIMGFYSIWQLKDVTLKSCPSGGFNIKICNLNWKHVKNIPCQPNKINFRPHTVYYVPVRFRYFTIQYNSLSTTIYLKYLSDIYLLQSNWLRSMGIVGITVAWGSHASVVFSIALLVSVPLPRLNLMAVANSLA